MTLTIQVTKIWPSLLLFCILLVPGKYQSHFIFYLNLTSFIELHNLFPFLYVPLLIFEFMMKNTNTINICMKRNNDCLNIVHLSCYLGQELSATAQRKCRAYFVICLDNFLLCFQMSILLATESISDFYDFLSAKIETRKMICQ